MITQASHEMYQVTRLNNGLTIATAEMPQMTSVSLGIWASVGGRHEPAEISGVSHFIEHMLFKGTRKRSARTISQEIEGIGGDLNAFTSEEATCFYSKACADRFSEVLDVLMDMVLNSTFPAMEVDKERDVIKEEVAMCKDQPSSYVLELLNEIIWPDQPLGRSLTGTEETLDGLNRRKLMQYQKHHYVAPSIMVTIAGNIRHDDAVEAVMPYGRRFSDGKRPTFFAARNGQLEPNLHLFTKDAEQTQVAMGIRLCSRHDPFRYPLRLLNAILGENMSSRLFQVVREDYGLAYCINSYIGFFDDVGLMTITGGFDTSKVHQGLKLIGREMKRLKEKTPSVAELRRAREYVLGQLQLSMESTSNQMMWMGEQLLAYGQVIPMNEVETRLQEVKPRHIRAAAQQFFRPERLSLALVSPLRTERGLGKYLYL